MGKREKKHTMPTNQPPPSSSPSPSADLPFFLSSSSTSSHSKATEARDYQDSNPAHIQECQPDTIDETSNNMPVLKGGLRSGAEHGINYTRTVQNGIPVSLSFFYGKPFLNTPELEHVEYGSNANKNLFDKNTLTRESAPRGDTQDKREDEDLSQLKELVSLAGGQNSDLLGLWAGECVVCEQAVALAIVHQPLCFSFDGYSSLADGPKMHGMMVYIAKLVKELNSEGKVQNAVGNTSTTTQPHIHFLSVPVCITNPECKQKAEEELVKFARFAKSQRDQQGGSQGDNRSSNVKDANGKNREPVKVDKWEDVDEFANLDHKGDASSTTLGVTTLRQVDPRDRVPLRVTVFCGKPIVDSKATTTRNMLSIMSFTLRWDANELATAARKVAQNPADGSQFYIALGAFLEHKILGAAEFCCSICTDRKLATTLVHRPISFRRDSTPGVGAQEARKLIFKLVQLVGDGCRWTAPATEAVLGSDGAWYVSTFVVPICRRDNVVCEETARIAAKRFLDNQITGLNNGSTGGTVKLVWPDLLYDTTLSDIYTVYNAGKAPKMVVKKIGLGVMSDPKIETKPAKEAKRAVERLRRKVESDYDAHVQKTHELKGRMEKSSKKGKSRADSLEEDLVFTYALNPSQLPYQLAPSPDDAGEGRIDGNGEQEEPEEGEEDGGEEDDEDQEDEDDTCLAMHHEKAVIVPLLLPSLFEAREEIGAHVVDQYGDDFLAKAVVLET